MCINVLKSKKVAKIYRTKKCFKRARSHKLWIIISTFKKNRYFSCQMFAMESFLNLLWISDWRMQIHSFPVIPWNNLFFKKCFYWFEIFNVDNNFSVDFGNSVHGKSPQNCIPTLELKGWKSIISGIVFFQDFKFPKVSKRNDKSKCEMYAETINYATLGALLWWKMVSLSEIILFKLYLDIFNRKNWNL